MKKLSVLLGIIAVFIGTVVVAITLLARRAHSISIIDGADGRLSAVYNIIDAVRVKALDSVKKLTIITVDTCLERR